MLQPTRQMGSNGDGRSSRAELPQRTDDENPSPSHALLAHSPSPSPLPEAAARCFKSSQPAWLATLLPALPNHGAADPSEEQSDDEEEHGPLFPTPETLRHFLALQAVRIDILRTLRTSLLSNSSATSAARARRRYTRLQLDVQLLHAVRILTDFAGTASERVHCSPDELTELQEQNLCILASTLDVLRGLMRRDEPDSADEPFVSVAERLCEHGSAEVFLALFESLVEESDLEGDAAESPLAALHCTLLEAVLRCLLAQLDAVVPESPAHLTLLRQIYMFIPCSHVSAVTFPPRGQEQGSESEILRRLVTLTGGHRGAALAGVAVQILAQVATTPVPNEHHHSLRVCGNPEHACRTSPLCTRGTPPAPVLVHPAHLNSAHGLLAASKLFVFPRNPALYLVERGLLVECLELLHPLLTKPAEHHPPHSAKPVSRSLFGRQFAAAADEDDEDDANGAVHPLPASPLLRPLRAFMHEPHNGATATTADGAGHHHASLRKEEEFMAQYATPKLTAARSDMGGDALMQFPLSLDAAPAVSEAPPSPAAHHRSAPLHQSNELLAVSLCGLTALTTRNAAISAHLCSQTGLLSFLRSCIVHPQLELNMLAAGLVAQMEHALAYAVAQQPQCSSPRHGSARAPAVNVAQLAGGPRLHPSLLCRRNSSASVKLHRRNSTSGGGSLSASNSPHLLPMSPSATGSPRIFALGGAPSALAGAHSTLTMEAAHKQLASLVRTSLQMLTALIAQQWGGSSARLHRHATLPLDSEQQLVVLQLVALLVARSAALQAAASAAVPVLTRMLIANTLSTALCTAAARCMASLCTLHAPNRACVLQAELAPALVRLLRTPAPLASTVRAKDQCGAAEHPAVQQQRLAILQLLRALSSQNGQALPVSNRAASSLLQLSEQDEASLVVKLVALVEVEPPAHLQLILRNVVCLMGNLLQRHSSACGLLVRAGALPKLARLTAGASVWAAPCVPPLPDAIDVTESCALPSHAHLMRTAALDALCQLADGASEKHKRALLDCLSVDTCVVLLQSDDSISSADELAGCGASDADCRIHKRVWLFLTRLMQPSVEGFGESSAADPAAPLLTARDVGCLLKQPGVATQGSLLAAIAARTDEESVKLLQSRPELRQIAANYARAKSESDAAAAVAAALAASAALVASAVRRRVPPFVSAPQLGVLREFVGEALLEASPGASESDDDTPADASAASARRRAAAVAAAGIEEVSESDEEVDDLVLERPVEDDVCLDPSEPQPPAAAATAVSLVRAVETIRAMLAEGQQQPGDEALIAQQRARSLHIVASQLRVLQARLRETSAALQRLLVRAEGGVGDDLPSPASHALLALPPSELR